jgi:hypothetical protein
MADYRASLNTISALLNNPAAFQGGRPRFQSVAELDTFLRANGFSLPAGNNTKYGPSADPDARQLVYLGPNNVLVKVKTAGYESGQRKGRATLSIEVTDGKGSLWEHTLFKVDADGKIIAKNVIDMDQPVVRTSTGDWGVRRANGKVEPIVKWEVIQGGRAAPFNRQGWADRGHLDLPSSFDKAGAAQIGLPEAARHAMAAPVRNRLSASRLGWGNRVRFIGGNQDAMSMLGEMLGQLIQSLGDIGIRRNVQQKLADTHAKYIEQALARGEGILIIISMQEWAIPDFNGQRARSLLAVYVQSGRNEAEALSQWRGQPRLMQGPGKGWRTYEEYAWIAP